jgi:hypothetical protein
VRAPDVASVYDPAGHTKQAVLLLTLLYVPEEHAEHMVIKLAEVYVPVLQIKQPDAERAELVYEPDTHTMHAVLLLAVLYVPAVQARHEVMKFKCEKVPDLQNEQLVAARPALAYDPN